jgi:adenylate cyclase class 2
MMPHGKGTVETEIKLRVPEDPAATRALLEDSGYRILQPRVFEANTLYDTADSALRRRGELIRIRRAGGRSVLTFKSADLPGRHKRREELETEVGDAGVIEAILVRIGLGAKFRYEKYSTEYQRESDGIAMLDETPIGVFLELEGRPEWIDSAARELGFTESAYILSSYGALYFEHCRRTGAEPGNMVFSTAESLR